MILKTQTLKITDVKLNKIDDVYICNYNCNFIFSGKLPIFV